MQFCAVRVLPEVVLSNGKILEKKIFKDADFAQFEGGSFLAYTKKFRQLAYLVKILQQFENANFT